MDYRNFKDPVYVAWRKRIYARDKYTCQWPGCKSKKKLNAHHIKRWAENPTLRFEVNNGITLCSRCHKNIQNKEEQYEQFFFKILLAKTMGKNGGK